MWRVFRDKPGPDGKPRLVSTHREPSPTLRLEAGDYIVNVAFGRAHLTRKIAISSERPAQERFVLNAGGLRLTPAARRMARPSTRGRSATRSTPTSATNTGSARR